jgi:hypothetical protein
LLLYLFFFHVCFPSFCSSPFLFHLPTFLPIHLRTCLSLYPSIRPSIHPFVSLSIYISLYLPKLYNLIILFSFLLCFSRLLSHAAHSFDVHTVCLRSILTSDISAPFQMNFCNNDI